MKRNSIFFKIIFCIFLFFIISISTIYSTLNITNNLGNIFIKQIFSFIIGTFILVIAYKNKKSIIKYSFILYIFINFLLILLLFLGTSINGSKCWLMIGPISFQPSEFMKIILIIVIANILEKNKDNSKVKTFIKILTLMLIPSILTFLEPDTGVVIIYFISSISIILFKGINKKWYYIITILLILLIGTFNYLYFNKQELLINILGNSIFYRIDRLLNWSTGTGYQLENSLITIASSGLYGFGFNNIPIYYPEASTDFIFTSFSSNFGLIGNIFFIAILIIFDSILLQMINSKIKRRDKYLIVGIFTMILYQQIQNIGMTIGLMPITGITLPFISYGGSSLLSYMFIFGIILRINHDYNLYIN